MAAAASSGHTSSTTLNKQLPAPGTCWQKKWATVGTPVKVPAGAAVVGAAIFLPTFAFFPSAFAGAALPPMYSIKRSNSRFDFTALTSAVLPHTRDPTCTAHSRERGALRQGPERERAGTSWPSCRARPLCRPPPRGDP